MNNTLKSILAVLAGLIFIVVTHNGIDFILKGIGILPKDNLFVGTGLILVVIGYRAIFSLIGCYLTARLSEDHPMRDSLILGIIGVIFSLIGVIANYKLNLGPNWYTWLLVIMTLPIAYLGGKLEVMRRRKQDG